MSKSASSCKARSCTRLAALQQTDGHNKARMEEDNARSESPLPGVDSNEDSDGEGRVEASTIEEHGATIQFPHPSSTTNDAAAAEAPKLAEETVSLQAPGMQQEPVLEEPLAGGDTSAFPAEELPQVLGKRREECGGPAECTGKRSRHGDAMPAAAPTEILVFTAPDGTKMSAPRKAAVKQVSPVASVATSGSQDDDFCL